MDLTFYRELIPDVVWAGQEPPAEVVAAAINTSQAYSSGLLIAVHKLGAGRFVLNTLAIRERLGRHPAAERVLRNMLRYAAEEANKPPAEPPADFAEVGGLLPRRVHRRAYEDKPTHAAGNPSTHDVYSFGTDAIAAFVLIGSQCLTEAVSLPQRFGGW